MAVHICMGVYCDSQWQKKPKVICRDSRRWPLRWGLHLKVWGRQDLPLRLINDNEVYLACIAPSACDSANHGVDEASQCIQDIRVSYYTLWR